MEASIHKFIHHKHRSAHYAYITFMRGSLCMCNLEGCSLVIGTTCPWFTTVEDGWVWIGMAECCWGGWVWLRLTGWGWKWLKVVHCGWVWLGVTEGGCMYLAVAGCDCVWLIVAECGWVWRNMPEYRWVCFNTFFTWWFCSFSMTITPYE